MTTAENQTSIALLLLGLPPKAVKVTELDLLATVTIATFAAKGSTPHLFQLETQTWPTPTISALTLSTGAWEMKKEP